MINSRVTAAGLILSSKTLDKSETVDGFAGFSVGDHAPYSAEQRSPAYGGEHSTGSRSQALP